MATQEKSGGRKTYYMEIGTRVRTERLVTNINGNARF
jgi:hypothetical protein